MMLDREKDRTVHGKTADGAEIARYDRTGKWYIEPATGQRRHVKISEAAALAAAGTYRLGLRGGSAFDRHVSSEKARLTAKASGVTGWEAQRYDSAWGGFRSISVYGEGSARFGEKDEAIQAILSLAKNLSAHHQFRVYNVVTGEIIGFTRRNGQLVLR